MPLPSFLQRSLLGLSLRAWLYVAIAFAVGIVLFLLIWMKQRDTDDFYRANGTTQSATGVQFEPLPGPDMDAVDSDAQPAPLEAPDDSARIVEPTPAPRPGSAPAAPAAADTVPGSTSTTDSPPILVSSPPPKYPSAALRRGDSGEALLRVHVGTDGVPYAIDLIRGSGSRLLDRAATDAVRKWRFRPAISGGQAVNGVVQVPIAFSPGQ
jgi:protein TonB